MTGVRFDLTGETYGRLTVVRFLGQDRRSASRWECRCECGSVVIVPIDRLRGGNTVSCGCYRREATRTRRTTHGQSVGGRVSSVYGTWVNLKHNHFDRMSPRWRWSAENFIEDMGARPEGHIFTRIDRKRGYTPDNCRWVTRPAKGS